MSGLSVLDFFCGAAGGWSLGLHRAGFETVAACEADPWRRAMFSARNPKALMYDDVRTLSAARLVSDLGYFPRYVFGSPPCQDASAANTKGRGVDGGRTGLIWDFVRLVGEGRPCAGALENVPGLRTRGAERIVASFRAIGYACEWFVVAASDVGANHERKRAWLLFVDPAQIGHGGGRPWRHGSHGNGSAYPARDVEIIDADCEWESALAEHAEMGRGASSGGPAREPWSRWNGGLASHLRLDDGISDELARLDGARSRAQGSLAGACVAAFGDAVVPQITESIGRAILRMEDAMLLACGGVSA